MQKYSELKNCFVIFIVLFLLFQAKSHSEWVHQCNLRPFENIMDIKSANDSTYLISTYVIDMENMDLMNSKYGLLFLKTTDYGKTWDSIFSTIKLFPISHQINMVSGVSFFNKDTIYLLIDLDDFNSKFFKTFDGGKTWDTTNLPFFKNYHGEQQTGNYINSDMYYFESDKIGLYYGLFDTLSTTDDRG